MEECKEGKLAFLLGKGVKGVSDIVVEEIGKCIMYWLGKWWQRRKDLLYGELMDGFSPLSSPVHEQLDTTHALLLFSQLIYLITTLECLLLLLSVCFSCLVLLCCVCCDLKRLNINTIKLLGMSSHGSVCSVEGV